MYKKKSISMKARAADSHLERSPGTLTVFHKSVYSKTHYCKMQGQHGYVGNSTLLLLHYSIFTAANCL